MATQIEQLRASFDKMSTVQKKQFIDKLKIQLQNSKNAEYINFLNDCVKKYNVSVRGGSSGSSVSVPTAAASSSVSAKGKQKKSPFKWIAVCLVIVLVVGGGLFVFSALNNSNSGGITGTNNGENDNKLIVGTWGTIEDTVGGDGIGIPFMTFIFKQDDTYTLIIPQYSIKKGVNPDYISQEGTYEFKGTTLTLKASYDSFGSAQTTEYKIELDDDEMIFVEETQVYDIYHVVNKGEKFIKK